MKWTEDNIVRLKQLCYQGKSNKDIAAYLDCKVSDVYNKRSALGITIEKCKGIEPNPEFEKALEPVKPKGMTKKVRNEFSVLENEVLLAMASDWTSIEDARDYAKLHEELMVLEEKYNALIGR